MTARRFLHIVLLLSWPLVAMSQRCDFEVRDFHENLTDLSAAVSNVKDLNGVTAALIRLVVRDTLFEVQANNGIIKQEWKTGELLVYVPPKETQWLTISHPHLGILRQYDIPLTLESKKTYDAEIVITNENYMRSLLVYGIESKTVDKSPVLNHDDASVPFREEIVQPDMAWYQPKQSSSQFHFLVHAGFSAIGIVGPTAGLALEMGKFYVGGDYTFGMEKVENVAIYYKKGGRAELGEAYNYSVGRASFRLGFNINPESVLQVVPQLGAAFTMISDNKLLNNTTIEAQFDKTTPVSASIVVQLRVRLGGNFYIYAAPEYSFVASADDMYKAIKEVDGKIGAWGEGFGMNAGLLLRF